MDIIQDIKNILTVAGGLLTNMEWWEILIIITVLFVFNTITQLIPKGGFYYASANGRLVIGVPPQEKTIDSTPDPNAVDGDNN